MRTNDLTQRRCAPPAAAAADHRYMPPPASLVPPPPAALIAKSLRVVASNGAAACAATARSSAPAPSSPSTAAARLDGVERECVAALANGGFRAHAFHTDKVQARAGSDELRQNKVGALLVPPYVGALIILISDVVA